MLSPYINGGTISTHSYNTSRCCAASRTPSGSATSATRAAAGLRSFGSDIYTCNPPSNARLIRQVTVDRGTGRRSRVEVRLNRSGKASVFVGKRFKKRVATRGGRRCNGLRFTMPRGHGIRRECAPVATRDGWPTDAPPRAGHRRRRAARPARGRHGAAVLVRGRLAPHQTGNGRMHRPAAPLARVGHFPTGGALAPGGRLYFTVSTGRALNDVRTVRVDGKRPQVVQTLPLPGASGGIAARSRAATSPTSPGSRTPTNADEQRPGLTGPPGRRRPRHPLHRRRQMTELKVARGAAALDGAAAAELPADERRQKVSYPDRRGRSRATERTLLVALNLADAAAIVNTQTGAVSYVPTGRLPYGAAILPGGKTGLITNETAGTMSVIDLRTGTKIKDIHDRLAPLPRRRQITLDNRHHRAFVPLAEHRPGRGRRHEEARARTLDLGRARAGPRRLPGRHGAVDQTARRSTWPRPRPTSSPSSRSRGKRPASASRAGSRPPPIPADVRPEPRKRLVWLAAKGFGSGTNPNGPNPYVGRRRQPPAPPGHGRPHARLRRRAADPRRRQSLQEAHRDGRTAIMPAAHPTRRPRRHAAAPGRPDQARLLHRAREPHLRPGPRRRRARRRRPDADAVRPRGDAEHARARHAASRSSTTSTPTPRRRSTATSGPAPRRSPTTCTRTGSRTTRPAAGPTTSASTRRPGPATASCSTRPSGRASPTSTSARPSPATFRSTSRTRTASTTPTAANADEQQVLDEVREVRSRRARRLLRQRRRHRQERDHRRRRLRLARRRVGAKPRRRLALRLLQAALRQLDGDATGAEVHLHGPAQRPHRGHDAGPPHAARDGRRERLRPRPDRRPDLPFEDLEVLGDLRPRGRLAGRRRPRRRPPHAGRGLLALRASGAR